ncbi:MAG: UvrD-helicase domain-containing protein [Alphaproteobacteria bacterium]|nr:UvrD-helicase domain-containing protein [Alphaproteobacteria bacterium]
MQVNALNNLDEINEQLLNSLNPEQHEAVISLDRPLLVLSGAGTGKTKVLTTKIAYMIENGYAFPSQILAVTFSNRAAREMKERLFGLTSGADGVWLGTFHSVCARILRRHADLLGMSQDFTIIDADDQTKLVRQIAKELNLEKKSVNGIVNRIGLWKDKGYRYDDSRIDRGMMEAQVYKIYQERLECYDSMDFGDLLLNVIRIFKNFPDVLRHYRDQFKYILVDEYQDTNMAQYIWLRLLSPLGEGLCCVGDDDQSIYSWRGAEVGNILRFEKDFINAKIVRLERNYRSGGYILGAASSLISNNQGRLGKKIWTEDGVGEKVKIKRLYNGFDEARFVADQIENLKRFENDDYGAMAVLVRAGYQTREFEDRFIAYGIPYKVVGGLKFYDRQEIKDIVAYMRLVYQPNDSLAFERVINTPKRGIGASAVSKFYEYSRDHNVSLFQAAKDMARENLLRPSVKISVEAFTKLIESITERKDANPSEIAKFIITATGYQQMLSQEKTTEAEGRIENLKELTTALEDFPDLPTFMEHVSLVMDSPRNVSEDLVSIMTLHSAKGLEFENVFLAGWEEGIFPHNLCLQEDNLEEERRLAYVGLTRAKKRAFISFVLNRRVHNQWQNNPPSRFLRELSEEDIEILR